MNTTTFNPNELRNGEWGTYAPSRRPKWREHKRKSDASNAFNNWHVVTLYRWQNNQWEEINSKQPQVAPAPPKQVAPNLHSLEDNNKQLMRVILEKFAEYDKRGQTYYGLEGMSTSHITLKAIADPKTLYAFWPNDQIERDWRRGNIYMIADDTLTRMQTAIRQAIEKLAKAGYIERLGNEHERRWRPVKSLKGATL